MKRIASVLALALLVRGADANDGRVSRLAGERVRVHVVPTEPGLFMYHCHNLEHEDSGMMRNCTFEI